MMRRDLLCAAPLTLLPIVAPRQVDAAETPVMRLFREWEEADAAEIKAATEQPYTPEGEAICMAATARACDLRERIIATPSESARDFVAKVVVDSGWGVFALDDETRNLEFWAEARALLG